MAVNTTDTTTTGSGSGSSTQEAKEARNAQAASGESNELDSLKTDPDSIVGAYTPSKPSFFKGLINNLSNTGNRTIDNIKYRLGKTLPDIPPDMTTESVINA